MISKMSYDLIIDVLVIGNGSVFFSFLNCTDLDELRQTSKEIHKICIKSSNYVLFYGLPLPKNGIFYDLFYRKYDMLENKLKKNEDFYIISRYRSLHPDPGPKTHMSKGDVKYNYMWNDMVPLEIAFMLKDKHLIQLLTYYKRSTAYRIYGYTSKYKFQSIILLDKYSENEIKNKILETRPFNWKEIE